MSQVGDLFDYEQYRSLAAASISISIVLLLVLSIFVFLRCISRPKQEVTDCRLDRVPIMEGNDERDRFTFSELAATLGLQPFDVAQLQQCGIHSLETLAHAHDADFPVECLSPAALRKVNHLKYLARMQL